MWVLYVCVCVCVISKLQAKYNIHPSNGRTIEWQGYSPENNPDKSWNQKRNASEKQHRKRITVHRHVSEPTSCVRRRPDEEDLKHNTVFSGRVATPKWRGHGGQTRQTDVIRSTARNILSKHLQYERKQNLINKLNYTNTKYINEKYYIKQKYYKY